MTEPDTPAPASDKPAWTTPEIEPVGTIHDVQGGSKPGLDANGLPARKNTS